MRRIVLALMTTISAVVLLFGYRTSSPSFTSTAAPTSVAAGPTTSDSGTTATSPSAGSSGTGSSATSTTYVGSTAQTRWGPVQVQITVSAGKVTAATAVQVPSGNNRDAQINDYAVPILDTEVVNAQDAGIDTVSGATVTSDGYITSLQSALDKAGL